jgi:hypothetical protein
MNNLANKITAYLGSKPDFTEEVLLQDDMVDGISNPYIKEWNITEKPKPTDAELNALENEAQDMLDNAEVISNRMSEYGSVESQIEFITENGLDAWKTKVDEIKTKYPKK